MCQSTAYLTTSELPSSISGESATSAANILWLNETLPGFMTREFALAPFGPLKDNLEYDSGSLSLWTGTTTLFGVNTTCEEPITWLDPTLGNTTYFNSTWGCQIEAPAPQTVAYSSDETRNFVSLYAGFGNADGSALYSIDERYCSPQSSSFFIQHVESLIAFADLQTMNDTQAYAHINATSRWCRASYYMQKVRATVKLPNHDVLSVYALDEAEDLPPDMFNVTDFEDSMNIGKTEDLNRTMFPTSNWPDQTGFLFDTPLDLDTLPPMVPFAIGTTQLPIQEYLSGTILDESYQAAYRILFARHVAGILSQNLDNKTTANGEYQGTTQAIAVVATFALIAQGILVATICLSLWLLTISVTRPLHLSSDPSTIEGLMRLTANSDKLIDHFKCTDQASNEKLRRLFGNDEFELRPPDTLKQLNLRKTNEMSDEKTAPVHSTSVEEASLVPGVQPHELSLSIGIAFLLILFFLILVIAILFIRALRNNGQPYF
jgi:hypothetical protein